MSKVVKVPDAVYEQLKEAAEERGCFIWRVIADAVADEKVGDITLDAPKSAAFVSLSKSGRGTAAERLEETRASSNAHEGSERGTQRGRHEETRQAPQQHVPKLCPHGKFAGALCYKCDGQFGVPSTK